MKVENKNPNNSIIESAGSVLGLVSLVPLFGLSYSIGFLSTIDTRIVQLFSAYDLLKFAGSRSLSIAMLLCFPIVIFTFCCISNTISNFFRSSKIFKKRIYQILSIFLLIASYVNIFILENGIFRRDVNDFVIALSVFFMLLSISFLFLYGISRVLNEIPNYIFFITFIFVSIISIAILGAFDANRNILFINRSALYQNRVCAISDGLKIEPIIVGEDYILSRKSGRNYVISDRSETKFVINNSYGKNGSQICF